MVRPFRRNSSPGGPPLLKVDYQLIVYGRNEFVRTNNLAIHPRGCHRHIVRLDTRESVGLNKILAHESALAGNAKAQTGRNA